MTAIIQKQGRNKGWDNLKPVQKGECRNPGGRPKGLAAEIRHQTKDGKELVECALKYLRGEKVNGKTPRPCDTLKALEWLADRAFGKSVELHADVSPDGEFKQLAKAYARELLQGGVKIADN